MADNAGSVLETTKASMVRQHPIRLPLHLNDAFMTTDRYQ